MSVDLSEILVHVDRNQDDHRVNESVHCSKSNVCDNGCLASEQYHIGCHLESQRHRLASSQHICYPNAHAFDRRTTMSSLIRIFFYRNSNADNR
jgi:hypothetical protein